MDTCASRLDFGAIASHGATGPLESTPRGSSAGPMTNYETIIWAHEDFSFTLVLINNFLFIDIRHEFPDLYQVICCVI